MQADAELDGRHRPEDVYFFLAGDAFGAGEEQLLLEVGLIVEGL